MRLRTGQPRVQGVQSLGWPPGRCNGRVVMRSSKPFCRLARGQAVYGVAGVAGMQRAFAATHGFRCNEQGCRSARALLLFRWLRQLS